MKSITESDLKCLCLARPNKFDVFFFFSLSNVKWEKSFTHIETQITSKVCSYSRPQMFWNAVAHSWFVCVSVNLYTNFSFCHGIFFQFCFCDYHNSSDSIYRIIFTNATLHLHNLQIFLAIEMKTTREEKKPQQHLNRRMRKNFGNGFHLQRFNGIKSVFSCLAVSMIADSGKIET